jgi:YidC/Oxa1 family membrane protein insertase
MQRSMLYVMPCMMGFIALTLPAGLPLYWITFNLRGILQHGIIGRNNKKAATASSEIIDVEIENTENKRGDTTDGGRGKKGKKHK